MGGDCRAVSALRCWWFSWVGGGLSSEWPGQCADDEEATFGHFFDGEADAFPSAAGVFDSAVGHVVDAPGGNVADNDAADFELVEGALRFVEVASEDAGLQAEATVVDDFQSLIEIGKRF